jgi:tRNA modification GTPase
VGRIDAAKLALANAVPHEFLLLDLHRALEYLDSLTGPTAPNEILKRIFSSFCIGK